MQVSVMAALNQVKNICLISQKTNTLLELADKLKTFYILNSNQLIFVECLERTEVLYKPLLQAVCTEIQITAL